MARDIDRHSQSVVSTIGPCPFFVGTSALRREKAWHLEQMTAVNDDDKTRQLSLELADPAGKIINAIFHGTNAFLHRSGLFSKIKN